MIQLNITKTDLEHILENLENWAEGVQEGEAILLELPESGEKVQVEIVCDECLGEGEVATDESDGEGHTMRGVGTRKCHKCRD